MVAHFFALESIFFIFILSSCHLTEQHRDGCRWQEPQLRYHEGHVLDRREVVPKIQQLQAEQTSNIEEGTGWKQYITFVIKQSHETRYVVEGPFPARQLS